MKANHLCPPKQYSSWEYLASIILHLMILLVMKLGLTQINLNQIKPHEDLQQRKIKILKLVGTKTGQKDYFSPAKKQEPKPSSLKPFNQHQPQAQALTQPQAQAQVQPQALAQNQNSKQTKLEKQSTDQKILKSLALNETKKIVPKTKTLKVEKLDFPKSQEAKIWSPKIDQKQATIKEIPNKLNRIFHNMPDINLHYEVPYGVSKDKLNAMELKFYGFHMRVYETFVNNILSSYYDLRRKYPYANLSTVQNDESVMMVTFNENGDSIDISPIQNAYNQYFNELLLNALDIMKVPNPPHELLKNKTLRIYFKLK